MKKKKLSYMEDVYYISSSLIFFFKNKYYKIFLKLCKIVKIV